LVLEKFVAATPPGSLPALPEKITILFECDPALAWMALNVSTLTD
jgi:hypothetical protein